MKELRLMVNVAVPDDWSVEESKYELCEIVRLTEDTRLEMRRPHTVRIENRGS
jgi:hypothetical protein